MSQQALLCRLINEVGELFPTKKKERGTETVANSDELKLNEEGDHSINEEQHELDTGIATKPDGLVSRH
jgi:hypothetical protein